MLSALRQNEVCLDFAPNCRLPEAQDEIVAVTNHDFALPVHSVFRTIDDVRAARAQLLRQCVNAYHAEVDIRGAFGQARTNDGLIGAIEEHLNLVSPHDRENRRSIRDEADARSIPITGYLKAE